MKALLGQRKVRVVALDLPTSWMMATDRADDFTTRIFEAVNGTMLDVLPAVARKDYEDRRRRQREGIEKARARGAYRGRPEDVARNQAILKLLKQGNSWSTVMASTGAARATVAKIAKRLPAG